MGAMCCEPIGKLQWVKKKKRREKRSFTSAAAPNLVQQRSSLFLFPSWRFEVILFLLLFLEWKQVGLLPAVS